MAKDKIGFTLSAVNKFAGSSLVKKLKLGRPAEKIAYISTRTGFQVINTANAKVQQAKNFFTPSSASQTFNNSLFDLSFSEEPVSYTHLTLPTIYSV